MNLNNILIDGQGGDEPHEMHINDGLFDSVPKVEVVFRKTKERLIEMIDGSGVIFGCVAWMTDPDILNALSKKCVQIVVQKEDFLRPDHQSRGKLYKMYSKLGCGLSRQEISHWKLDTNAGNENADAVRCFGNHNSVKDPAFPRMHHKFAVFCDSRIEKKTYDNGIGETWTNEVFIFKPKSVWTGSFNFTKNAVNSLENAVIIHDERIAQKYFDEYLQIFGMSEKLDWESEWVAPEYRIGS